MKIYFSFYIVFYFLLIIKVNSLEEEDKYDFLENKTLDHLRQIFWTTLTKFDDDTYRNLYKDIMHLKTSDEIKNLLKNEISIKLSNYDKVKEDIKQNQYFKFENKTQFKEGLKDKNLPKNFLINFAFNIDKYDRTERYAINSASDYLNYYQRNELINFINSKIDYYNFDIDNITKIVLNNIDNFAPTDVKNYYYSKNQKELVQIMYGFEYYCNNMKHNEQDGCQLSYQLYDHNLFPTRSSEDIHLYLSNYIKKININIEDVEWFINLIENRGFSYINENELFGQLNKTELIEYIKAFETYNERQENTTLKLKFLEQYIKIMDEEDLRNILSWGISKYPELAVKNRFLNIISNELNLKYGQIKEFIKVFDNRAKLLRYAYNIYTFQNNITSIYDKEVIDILRKSEKKLYEQIFKDANKNKDLKKKEIFEEYANLHPNSLEEYFKHLQRNQLKICAKALILYYYEKKDKDKSSLPLEKEKIESLSNLNNEELLNTAILFANKDNIKKSEEFYFRTDNNIDEQVYPYFSYSENIMDFFRSTNTNYLRLWLRKYELMIRKKKSQRFLMGGLKNNFMNINEFSKNDILKAFDIYVYEYPELFDPIKFIKIVGLDTDETPHSLLVKNANNMTYISTILFSMIGHLQRKNIQLNFNSKEVWTQIVFPSTESYKKNAKIKQRYLYQIFRIMNIFPELNNKEIFLNICYNPSSRIINIMEINSYMNISELFSKDRLSKIAENINYYYKQKNINDSPKNYNNDNKTYFEHFIQREEISSDEILASRIIDGDFYQIFYDYELYLRNEKEIVIDNIYNNLSIKYNESVVSEDKKNNVTEKINAIKYFINKYEELQDPTYFDLHYNKIDINSEGYSNVNELYKFLNITDNKNIFYYCLIANIIIIKIPKNYKRNIYLNIHYMSKVSMIRYILTVANSDSEYKEKLSPKKLPKLVKKYMLDIGSDNIYDLTLY